ncbi:MAG: DMT family transporter [Nitrospinota bacterium]
MREGLRDSTPRMAILVTALIVPVILGLWTSLMPPKGLINLRGVLWLILAGITAPGFGRTFLVLSLYHLGVARSAPITNSHPFAVAIFAILFLGEKPGVSVMLGMVAIVGGVVLITARGSSESWQRRHLVYPIGTAVFVAAAIIMRKTGMNYIPHPLFGAFLASAAALPCFLLLMPRLPTGGRTGLTRHSIACFGSAAVVNCLGAYFFFKALQLGDVTVVAPLMTTTPLFNLILAYIFLRYLEPLSRRVVIGTIMTVLGTAAILLFQGR